MMKRPWRPRPARARLAGLLAAVLLGTAGGPVVFAAPPPIILDGDFADWDGRITFWDTSVKDEPDDQKSINFKEDIEYFYYATNEGQPWLYFRVDRYPKPGGSGKDGIDSPVYYIVYIDCNNSHTSPTDRFEGFQDPVDHLVICAFVPEAGNPNASVVVVHAPDFFFAPGMKLDPAAIIWPTPATPASEYQGPWGQPYDQGTGTGGLWVEFGVPFTAFEPDFEPGQMLRFFVGATLNNPLNKISYPQQDFCPNVIGGVTDAPVSTLGLMGTALLILTVLSFAYWSARRRWPVRTAPEGSGR